MEIVINVLDQVRTILRSAYVVILVVTLILCVVAWLARSRRVGAFSALGRFSRKVIDPLLDPVDRMILRAGGTGTATPLWAFVLVFVAGAASIFVVTALRDGAVSFSRATNQGAGGLLRLGVYWTFAALQFALLVRVVTSWIGGTNSAVGRLAHRMTEWFLAPLRNVLPPMGNFDLSPLVAWFLLNLVAGVVMSAL